MNSKTERVSLDSGKKGSTRSKKVHIKPNLGKKLPNIVENKGGFKTLNNPGKLILTPKQQ